MYPPVTQFETRALRAAGAGTRAAARRRRRGLRAAARRHGAAARRTPASRSSPRPGTATMCCARSGAHRPDVAVIDIRMPPDAHRRGPAGGHSDPRQSARRRRARALAHLEERYARELLEDGAEGIGYLLKDRVAEIERFIAAVERVARGGSVTRCTSQSAPSSVMSPRSSASSGCSRPRTPPPRARRAHAPARGRVAHAATLHRGSSAPRGAAPHRRRTPVPPVRMTFAGAPQHPRCIARQPGERHRARH